MKLSHSKIIFITGLVLTAFLIAESAAAKVEVTLDKPEKFRDILSSDNSQSRSIKMLNKDLTQLFNRVAKDYISDNDTLSIQVTQVDLVGDIEHMVGPNMESMRVVRSNDSFKLYFKFESKNADKGTSKQGEKQIRDFMRRDLAYSMKHKHDKLSYLEKPLKQWFKEEFSKL